MQHPQTNLKELLGKLFRNELNATEEKEILQDSFLETYMKNQWDSSITITDHCLKKQIWKKIENKLWKKTKNYLPYYKIYSVAATFLLLISIGYTLHFLTNNHTTSVFVTNTGIQNTKQVVLPDGTIVQMGPLSTLEYPAKFDGDKRLVNLIGQAFFEVASDKEKPFTVKTPQMEITALGTTFEIFNYGSRNNAETTLQHGKIKVELLKRNADVQQALILNPGDKISFEKRTGSYQLEENNINRHMIWHKDGKISFKNETLKNIIPRLEQWFGRDIVCKSSLLDSYRFTFKVRDESLESILFLMSTTSKLKYEKREEEYIITFK